MFRTFSDVRPEERAGVVGAFLALLRILAGHTLLETARDALFLARLPPSQLPWAYLAIAGLALGLGLGARGRHRLLLTRRYELSVLLIACALITFAFWHFSSLNRSAWTLYALYVWSGLVGTLTGMQFWLVLGELYTLSQAKRIYRVIATGSLLGAVAGAAAARVIAGALTPQYLVLAAALAFAVTGLGPALLLRRPEGSHEPPLGAEVGSWFAEALTLVKRHGYVQGLGGLVLVSTVALTLADYVFKSAVAREVPAASLASFFATFYAILNALALLVQILFMGWVFQRLGLHRAQCVLPVLILLGAAGVAFGGGMVAAYLLKGADGTLRHSLHRTSTELLFVPLPDGIRSRVKPFIDVVGQRGGQALASLAILAELGLNRGDAVLAGAAGALCVIWIAWAADLKAHYLDLFRTALREGTLHDRADLPELDVGALETLFAALNSRDDAEVIGAMDVLAIEGRVRLIPALILYHPSKPVVLSALEHFERAGRADHLPVADRLLDHADPEIRAGALRARLSAAPDEQVLRRARQDPSPLVRATALAGLVSSGWVSDESQEVLDELLAGDDPEAFAALARAVRRQPAPVFADMLLRLGASGEDQVLLEVAHAMGAVKSEAFFPALLSMLSSRPLRDAARAALRACGQPALEFLDASLGDVALPHEIRRHLPRTISQFPPAEAARVLLAHLLPEPDGMVRFKIIRGLGRLAADHSELRLDNRVLREATQRTLTQALRLGHWRATLLRGAREEPRRATRGHDLLASLLRDKEVHALERLFRLLGLQQRGEDFRNIHRGLRSRNPRVRSSSRELLEHLVPSPLRPAVLSLVDEAAPETRSAASAAFLAQDPLSYEALLEALLEQPSESLRCIAAYHVGELGLAALRGKLESIELSQAGFFLARVVERTLRLLAEPERGSRMPAESAIVGTVGRMLALRKLPMLASLPTEELALIAERSRERFYPRGSVLLREGEPIAALRFVLEGRVHMSRRGLRLGHANPGAAVGGLGVLARESSGDIEAVAEQDTLVLEFDADDVFETLEDRFAILHHMLREMSGEIVRLAKRLPVGARPPFPVIEGVLPPRDLDLVERILFLRQTPTFSKSSINALAELSRGLSEVSFDPGVTLWREGEASGGVLLLLSGRVRGTSQAGLDFAAGPGWPLGGAESVAGLPRWFHALTETRVVALHADREGLIDVFEDNADMAFDYLAVVAKSLLDMLETMAGGALERFYGCDPKDPSACATAAGPA